MDRTAQRVGGVESMVGGVESMVGGTESMVGGTESMVGGTESMVGGVESMVGGVESLWVQGTSLQEVVSIHSTETLLGSSMSASYTFLC